MDEEKENRFFNSEEFDNQEEISVTPEEEAAVRRAISNREELTFEQRRILRVLSNRDQQELRRWSEEHGIVRQVIFDHVCRTTPAHIENILMQTFTRLRYSNPSLVQGFNIEKWSEGHNLELKVSFSKLGFFGGLGTIYATPVNDIEARIELIGEGVLAPFMDREDGEKLYWQTIGILQAFAGELRQFFHISHETGNLKKPSNTTPSHPPGGRPPDPRYQKAFPIVQAYILDQGFSDINAIRQAYMDCVRKGEIDDDKIDLDMFTSAMKTRLKKWRSE